MKVRGLLVTVIIVYGLNIKLINLIPREEYSDEECWNMGHQPGREEKAGLGQDIREQPEAM